MQTGVCADVGGGTPLADSVFSTLAAQNNQKKNQQLLCITSGILVLEEYVPEREMSVKSVRVYLLNR